MPEGKLRSGVYRSFIMCDDPRGVVERGAIKKQSKSRSSSNQRCEHPPLKGKEKSEMARRKSTSDAAPSSMQLLRVSKGIEKLNVAIESWSKGLRSYEAGRPEDIAKDLLRGALDLEESLAMLSGLQEDGIKQKPRKEDLRFQRSMSDRFGERNPVKQEDVASRDCYQELRKVVRESFLRQNLVPQTTSDFASSSTQSSSDIPPRAPSLIARLMGLDASPHVPPAEKPNILKLPTERQEQLKKKKKKERPEIVRYNSTRDAQEISNSSAIVLIRPQPDMEQKPGSKRPVMPKKPRMQEEVHPRMIYQRKDPNKKDRESKGMVRKVAENEGKVIKLLSPSKAKSVTRDQKISVKKEDGEGKDRYNRPLHRALKPTSNPATPTKSNNSSDISRNKSRPPRLSSTSNRGEQKSGIRENKTCRPKGKKKVRQQENDLASENNSSSSQDTCNQDHCDNGEVSSCAATVEHSHDPETSQISLKSFLSCSQDFLSYAGDLFDFKTNNKGIQEAAFQNRDSIVISDQRLALDFAKEVAKRKSLLLVTEPTCFKRSSVQIDKLLMEVCDGFESLRSYRNTFLGDNRFVKESIQMVLEKDLHSKKTEMTSGVWDLGWTSEFQIDETHQAVVDLEKLILSGLIQEILS